MKILCIFFFSFENVVHILTFWFGISYFYNNSLKIDVQKAVDVSGNESDTSFLVKSQRQ